MQIASQRDFPTTDAIRIRRIEPIAIDFPLPQPIVTPMATIDSVGMLFVRIEDEDGIEGLGEIWCNFPRFGTPHRARMLREIFIPRLQGKTIVSPVQTWHDLTAATHILQLQSGEPGPVSTVIAGIDIALWDIAAKKAGMPLWRFLGGKSPQIQVYGSLGKSNQVQQDIDEGLKRGFRSFKLRVWDDVDQHLPMCRAARQQIGAAHELMADANSSWDPYQAEVNVAKLADLDLAWVEEPIPVDAPAPAWQRLAQAASMPLAGGENMLTPLMFDTALAHGGLQVLQPDMAKWGGFSGVLPLARRAIDLGYRFCPHMFSSAVGLSASAHLLAATNSTDGTLEYGLMFNPVRDALMPFPIHEGRLQLTESPGLGIEFHLAEFTQYRLAV